MQINYGILLGGVEYNTTSRNHMKVRDSGMSDEEMWSGLFDPAKVLAIFSLGVGVQDLVEFGCGYGTFTLAAAAIASGTVHALDIEPEMVSVVRKNAVQPASSMCSQRCAIL